MGKPTSEEIQENWKKTILEQQNSGDTISFWCLKNHFHKHQFLYWRKKLFPTLGFKRSSFKELADKEIKNGIPSTEIVVEYGYFKIYIKDNLNPHLLKSCLEVLKKC
jgi:hypothetical protein